MNEVLEPEEHHKRIDKNTPMEGIVADLHASGMTILDAVKTVKELYHLSLQDAQRLVLEHPAWAEETRSVLTLDEMALIIVQDTAYFSWVEWFCSGVNGLGMARMTSTQGEQWQINVSTRLSEAATREQQIQHAAIASLVSQAQHTDEVTDALVAIISMYDSYEAPVIKLAVETLAEVGFPQNGHAICWLVNLVAHPHTPGRQRAIDLLQRMDVDIVMPYFLAAFVNPAKISSSRHKIVSGLCEIIKSKHEWAEACGPAITYLLSHPEQNQGNRPELATLLAILESIHPKDVYAIPVLYHFACQTKGTEIGQRIVQHLLSYEDEAIRYYKFHMRWLIE